MDKISGSLVHQVIFTPLQRASLGGNSACTAFVHYFSISFSKPQTTFKYIYTNTFMSKVSRDFDKLSTKLHGQDKLWLELAVGWINRELRFCAIYKYTGGLCLI